MRELLTWSGARRLIARNEGISSEVRWAVAHGDVVHNATLCAETTDARARVLALVAFARLGAVAVGVCNTLGLAALVRVAEVVCTAAAYPETVVLATVCVGSAATLIAWVPLDSRLLGRCERDRQS